MKRDGLAMVSRPSNEALGEQNSASKEKDLFTSSSSSFF
jgi:hypothetical protein